MNDVSWDLLLALQADPDWLRALGQPASTSMEGRLRSQTKAALGELAQQGHLPPDQLPLALQLVDSLQLRIHRYCKAGVLVASLLLVLAAARGTEGLPATPAAAAAAARAVGQEAGSQAVGNQVPRLEAHWQASRKHSTGSNLERRLCLLAAICGHAPWLRLWLEFNHYVLSSGAVGACAVQRSLSRPGCISLRIA
jgi:hypothetical protein